MRWPHCPPAPCKDKIVFFNLRMERTRDGSGYGKAVTVRAAGPSGRERTRRHRRRDPFDQHEQCSAFRIPGATRYTADRAANSGFRHLQSRRGCARAPVRRGKPVRLRMSLDSRELPQAQSASVVGEIPGTDRAGEIVMLGAHLDSWDPGVGALDDGAGVAIMMGVAKLIQDLDAEAAAHDPRGAVRERGIRHLRLAGLPRREPGARSTNMCSASKRTSAPDRCGAYLAASTRRSCRPSTAIYRALAPLKLARGDNEARGGADLEGLGKLGMPILEPALDGTTYFDVHHTANDTLAQVDPAALRQSVAAFAVSVWLGAQYPGDWQRVEAPKPPRR